MQKVLTIALSIISAAVIADTRVGDLAMKDAVDSPDNIAVGRNAGGQIKYSANNIVVGNAAGYGASNVNSSVAIGGGAMSAARNCDGVVAIGQDELAGVGGLSDTTSINKQQLFISKPADAFCINPQKADSITNAPLWYMGGTLHFNVSAVEGIALGRAQLAKSYDFYLAPDGNDANDGRSYKTPKKTFDGVWTAANALDNSITNVTCAVFAGMYYVDYTNTPARLAYNPSASQLAQGYRMIMKKRVHFIAIDGPAKTCLSAPEDNFTRDTMVSLGVSFGDKDDYQQYGCDYIEPIAPDPAVFRRQTLEGFTVRKFSGTFGGSYTKTAPTFTGFDFKNCIITENLIAHAGFGEAAVFGCRFFDCEITGNTFVHTGGDSYCVLFHGCDFYRTHLHDNEISLPEGATGQMRWGKYSVNIEDSYINIDMAANSTTSQFRPYTNTKSIITGSTLAFMSPDGSSTVTVAINEAYTNTLIVLDTAIATTTGDGNVSMSSADFRRYHNPATGVAVDIASDAVRMDERDDAGWKDSGLNVRKILRARADIRVENGTLVVYQNGTAVGTLPMNAVAVAYASPSSTPAPAQTETPTEMDDDGERRVMIAP